MSNNGMTTLPSDTGSPDNAGGYEALYPQLMEAKRLILACGQEPLLREWQRIYDRYNEPSFTVAVVGEHSRGKSTLLNLLLGSEVAPTDCIPAMDVMTRIRYGHDPLLTWIGSDGSRNTSELAPEVWDVVVRDEQKIDPRGTVEIEYPDDWLRKTGIQLLDTPGLGSIAGENAADTWGAVASSDATLVVVSANLPMSLTEQALLEQHILARKIPRAAVVLTHLDKIPESSREKVITFVKDKLEAWAMDIPVWVSGPLTLVPGAAQGETVGPDMIKNAISMWAYDELHILLRKAQVGAQLRALLKALQGALNTSLQALHFSNEERREALRASEELIERIRLNWSDLGLELQSRENECVAWLEKELQDRRQEISGRLQQELQLAPEPKAWLEKDLPSRLRQEMLALGRGIEDPLQLRIGRDADWISARTENIFDLSMPRESSEELAGLNGIQVLPITGKVSDVGQTRLVSRLAFGGITIVSFLLFAPLGMALGIGGGLLSEVALNEKVKGQKQGVSGDVDTVVIKTMSQARDRIIERVHIVYAEILNELRKREISWTEAQRLALGTGETGPDQGTAQLEQLLKQVQKLAAEIST